MKQVQQQIPKPHFIKDVETTLIKAQVHSEILLCYADFISDLSKEGG